MNTNNLIKVLSIQSKSRDQFRMFAYIIRECKKLGVQYETKDGNIYITKGESTSYPCIVAHMDTVHRIVENLTVVNVQGNLIGINTYTMKPTGIGGDDKVGIFIALECLKFFDNIKVAFFRDEEIGCQGSYIADEYFFEDCNFVLQCDRRGNSDFIIEADGISLSSETFQNDIANILNSYGYNLAKGMMTDVMALKEIGIKCSMANISCGYYNPHSRNEYVNLKDVENCLELVKDIIYNIGNEYYPHIYDYIYNDQAYCIDCWRDVAIINGLCKTCYEYYTSPKR